MSCPESQSIAELNANQVQIGIMTVMMHAKGVRVYLLHRYYLESLQVSLKSAIKELKTLLERIEARLRELNAPEEKA